MNKNIGLGIAKLIHFYMKPNILTCPESDLPDVGFLAVNWPFSNLSLHLHCYFADTFIQSDLQLGNT